MSRLVRASEIMGLPVVSIQGGEDVAEVRDVVYGSDEGRLLGFTLNKRGFLRGKLREVLPADSVAAIGGDAVMIDDDSCCLVKPSEAPDAIGRPDSNRNVLGNPVLTDGGRRLGTVTDLVVSTADDGDVVGYELQRHDSKESWFVPRPAQLAVSGDALLVPADVESYISDDLSGFGGAVDRYRQEHPTQEGGS